jgi:hypothetical protein
LVIVEDCTAVRKMPAAAALVAMLITGCARDNQLSSPLASAPVTVSTTSTSTSTTAPTSTPTTAPATTVPPPPASTAPVAAGTAPPATSPPESVPASTPAPTTAPPPGSDCTTLAAMPADAAESASKAIDVDADGAPDVVRTYSVGAAPVAGDWHLRVELATGQGVDIALPDDPAPAAAAVLGGTYIGSDVDPGPGGMRPAIFVKTGAGASTSIISLFRLDECTLVTIGGGTPFPVGASATHSESLRCEGVAGTSLLVFHQVQLSGDGVTYEVIDTGYTRDGDDLVVYGSGPQTSNSPTIPPVTSLIDCPGVDQP